MTTTGNDIDALLKHLELYYSDRAITHDMDCVCPLVAGWRLDVVKAYAKARRHAEGFRKNDPKSNNHNKISAEAWDRINAARKVGFIDRSGVRSIGCGACGQAFAARRADARFCGPRCRQRASRSVTVNRLKSALADSSANPRNSGASGTAIAGAKAHPSVTGQAA